MKTYTARLEREEDGRLSVELEEEPRVHTWGRTVDQALARVREATALWFQADEASIGLVPRPVLPKAAATAVDQARSRPVPVLGLALGRAASPPSTGSPPGEEGP